MYYCLITSQKKTLTSSKVKLNEKVFKHKAWAGGLAAGGLGVNQLMSEKK